jgi:predicted CXXCH cytochrome family protein
MMAVPMKDDSRTKRCGLILALIGCAALVFFLGPVLADAASPQSSAVGVLTPEAPSNYVGSETCVGCHAVEGKAWRASQHARAMQAARPDTVLGDFSDKHAEHFSSRGSFKREGGRFVVETEAADGKPESFPVDYTFGIEPLQQYLTTLPRGRVQVLPYAWDSRGKEAGGQRWFHLYPKEDVPPGGALHWTGALQNWNYMCADCHSTAVRKRYDASAKLFDTTFAEVSVGCESCHGAGRGHALWAANGRDATDANKGFATAAAKRPTPDWTIDAATGNPAHGVTRPPGDETETCGVCHSRRGQFAEGWQPGQPLMDYYRPVFLTPDLFEDDGQMRDEVFNSTSFQQSKMFAKGVVCSECHDPHSAKLKADGAEVCGQCHAPEKFATAQHSGHQTGPAQPDCISCHMPKKTYMVVDARHDHSFRVPRPDLTVSLGISNTCNACHSDKTPDWAAAAVQRWHGPQRRGFQTYGPAFHAARRGDLRSRDLLLATVRDTASPAIARATALHSLQGMRSTEVHQAIASGLSDADAMVRIAALGGLASLSPEERWRLASPLLADPIRAVRMEAATTLAEGPPADASPGSREAFPKAVAEYVEGERFNADRFESRAALGRFFVRQGRFKEAEAEYLAAISLGQSGAPRVDLADLYRMLGREAEAEGLLREAIASEPRLGAPHHGLGLSLIRQKRYGEATGALQRAAELDPTQARFAYVYAVLLQSTGRAAEAEAVLLKGLQANPSDVQLLATLVQVELSKGGHAKALSYVDRLRILLPDDASLEELERKLKNGGGSSSAPD